MEVTKSAMLDPRLTKMFEDHKNQGKSKPNKEEILAKYFIPRKDKEVFRILPPIGDEYIETAYFHTLKVNGKYIKAYCPRHNDQPEPKRDDAGNVVKDSQGRTVMVRPRCPLCEKADFYLNQQDKSILKKKKEELTSAELKIKEKNDALYKEAMKWSADKYYIVRGIDRGATKDGVKFWRFKANKKRQGVYDKLIPVLSDYVEQTGQNFTDPQKGIDIVINVVDNHTPTGQKYRDVSSVMARPASVLCEDPVTASAWLNDKTTWRDVFKPKSAPKITTLQYLELAAEGNAPYWDDSDPQNKRWVFPNHPELEAAANTRDENFQSGEVYEDESYSTQTYRSIEQISAGDVGTFKDDAMDVITGKAPTTIDDLDDLPF